MSVNYIKPDISIYEIELEQVVLNGSNEPLYYYLPFTGEPEDIFNSPYEE